MPPTYVAANLVSLLAIAFQREVMFLATEAHMAIGVVLVGKKKLCCNTTRLGF